MRYVVKASVRSGHFAWIKRKSGPYRLGPREQATTFRDRGEANRVISDLPKTLSDSVVEFSIELIDDPPEA